MGVCLHSIRRAGKIAGAQMIVFLAFLVYLFAVRWLDLHYELRRIATKPKEEPEVHTNAIGFEIPDTEE